MEHTLRPDGTPHARRGRLRSRPTRPVHPQMSQAPDTTARLDALLDATETGEWEWDFTTGEITWSPTLGPLHGKPRGWAPGNYEEWRALIHPEDFPALEEAARRARSTGAGYELEFRATVPDGSLRWLFDHGKGIRNEKGEEIFNFGKHKNKKVASILKDEPAYYDWMMNGDFPQDTKRKLTEIKLRGFKK